MERQRSFSIKATRVLFFSCTISSSVVFLTFFTIWVFKSTPTVLQEAGFGFNKTFLGLDLKPIAVQNFTGFTKNFSSSGLKNSVLIDNRTEIPENASGFSSKPVLRKENESETPKAHKDKVGYNGNFSTVQAGALVPETPSGKIQLTTSKTEEKVEALSSEKITDGSASTVLEKTEARSKGRTGERTSGAISVGRSRSQISGRLKKKSIRECDVAKGKWIYDASYPLYTNSSCPFIDEGFDCAGNGRLDKDYMKWRWQTQDCDIPRFNATKMLELIRGKRLIFVGDSINRNQWESMLCMLMGALKDPKRVYETHRRKITKEKGNYSFRFVDYQCTVEYYVSHFLVHESKAKVGQRRVQTLRIDSIDHGSSRWRGADILIFNTAHWWSHYKTKAGINYYQEGSQVHPQLDVSTAFRRALMTWAAWVDRHINQRKTRVFFRSAAPSHFRGGQWNSGGHCTEATQPLNTTLSTSYSEKNAITEDIIKHMKTAVTFLNVTSLSEFRIDGHPSMYGKKFGMRYGSSTQDCSHWCLPGVPDTWNELLYFHLISRG
uniref:Uncharacterized protein n=2 Tax=Rhizophora mucronata TaxID=61149 RepID=A0A2P2J3Y9_RHIMU